LIVSDATGGYLEIGGLNSSGKVRPRADLHEFPWKRSLSELPFALDQVKCALIELLSRFVNQIQRVNE